MGIEQTLLDMQPQPQPIELFKVRYPSELKLGVATLYSGESSAVSKYYSCTEAPDCGCK